MGEQAFDEVNDFCYTVHTVLIQSFCMLSVIRTGGKQYLVKQGQELKVEKLGLDAGAPVEFEVLLTADQEDSENPTVEVGAPLVSKKLNATVVSQDRSKKVAVVKYKRKVRYRRRTGHRQSVSKIKVS